MARGKNSPVIGNNGVIASPKDLSNMTALAKDIFLQATETEKVDLYNDIEVKNRILDYLTACEQRGLKPGNLGLYASLGLSKQQVHSIITGRDKNVSSAVCDLIKKAVATMGAYREMLGAEGKINPITMIFWQKNYDGLTDTTTLEVVPSQGIQAELTPEQVQKAIEKDIPIDTDAIEL